jgi:CRISPR-associated protein Cas5
MDLQILKEKTDLNQMAILYIEPLAPLSLVTALPGAYYRSQREPSDFMIYGLIENLLGWHFTDSERNPIIKDLKKFHKKQFKIDLIFNKTKVGYNPLLQNHLKIEKLLLKPFISSYEDYWTQHLKDVDERHAKGTRNYDSKLDYEANIIYSLPNNERDKKWRNLFENNNDLFPIYYQSPTKREFIIVQGKFGYKINITESLYNHLLNSIKTVENPLYLGTNEGWVHINMEKL